jgi:hypothetical protein
MPTRPSLRHIVVPLCVLTALLVGCVDFTEVGKFADISKSASSSLPALVADIHGTCERRAAFAPSAKQAETLETCKKLAISEPGILKAQQVLLDYMAALKSLAGDQSVTYGKELDSSPDDLSKSRLDSKQVSAVAGLAKKLADAALNGYRRKELANLIGSTNDDVQVVTGALRTIIDTDYKRELSQEREGAQEYYQSALKKYQTNEPLAAIAVRRDLQLIDTSMTGKEQAADAYGKIMEDIATGHQKLYESRGKWTTRSLIKDVGPIVKDLYESTQKVAKAF